MDGPSPLRGRERVVWLPRSSGRRCRRNERSTGGTDQRNGGAVPVQVAAADRAIGTVAPTSRCGPRSDGQRLESADQSAPLSGDGKVLGLGIPSGSPRTPKERIRQSQDPLRKRARQRSTG